MTIAPNEVRGEFEGRPYVVKRGHRSEPPPDKDAQPKWWILEFEGSCTVLMTAGSGDTVEYVRRRAQQRLRSMFE